MTTCRTCKYLDVRPNKAGRVVAHKDSTYRCNAPVPVLPALPASDTFSMRWPPRRSWMRPNDGEGCPTYEPREKKGY